MKKLLGMDTISDRISQLPDGILHHILSLLEPEDAFSAACLSKSWFKVWLTCPDLTFSFYPHDDLPEKKYKLEKFVENTISRFSKSELSVDSLRINCLSSSYPYTLLLKLIRFVVEKQVKILRVESAETVECLLPDDTIFAAKSLIELELRHCRFKFDEGTKFDHFNNLKILIFESIYLKEWALDKLFSSIPLIEEIELSYCNLLFQKLRVSNVPKLKRFKMHCRFGYGFKDGGVQTLEIVAAPSLESFDYCGYGKLNIDVCQNLKRLILQLEYNTVKSISFSNFPFLEYLEIRNCFGQYSSWRESKNLNYHVSSKSLKHLQLLELVVTSEVMVDAPNLLLLEYIGDGCNSISFRYPPKQLKLTLLGHKNEDAATWLLRVRSFFMKLVMNHTKIYLSLGDPDMHKCFVSVKDSKELPAEPEVEHLALSLSSRETSHQALVDSLFFWSCHPMYLSVEWACGVKPDSKLIKCLWENIMNRAGTILKYCCDFDQHTEFEIKSFNATGDGTLDEVMKAVEEGKGVCFKLKWSA